MANIDRYLKDQGWFINELCVATDNVAFIRAKRIWERTGLPIPDHGEYLYGDHGINVYLNPLGLVASFRSRAFRTTPIYETRSIRHDAILQPLYSRDLSADTTFELCPGVKRSGAKKEAIQKLTTNLKNDGIIFHDPNPGYVGFLPGGRDHAVVANRSAIRLKSKTYEGNQMAGLQDKIFGDLSEQLTEAFSSASGAKIQAALSVCSKITSLKEGDPAKILYGSWTERATLGPRQSTIVTYAHAYAEKLVPFYG